MASELGEVSTGFHVDPEEDAISEDWKPTSDTRVAVATGRLDIVGSTKVNDESRVGNPLTKEPHKGQSAAADFGVQGSRSSPMEESELGVFEFSKGDTNQDAEEEFEMVEDDAVVQPTPKRKAPKTVKKATHRSNLTKSTRRNLRRRAQKENLEAARAQRDAADEPIPIIDHERLVS